jgi:signal transduction histidine kinase
MLRLKLRHSAPRRGEPTAEERALRAAYWTDAVSVLRRRLDLTAALFLLFVGVAMLAEMFSYPERARIVALVYGAEVAACLLAMAACRAPRLRVGQRAIGAVLMALLAALMSGYDAWVGNPAELLAMAQVSLLMGLVVLLPWGWICQLVVASMAFATFAATVPYLSQTSLVIHSVLALAAAATTSVCGALFLDRYRYEAFRRSALHREEAEIAAVLLHVGEALTRHLDQPDVLECVNRLTVEALGCDWSSTYLWDPERRAFRLRANAGATPEVRASVAQIDFAPDRLPGLEGFRPGELIEVADVAGQPSLLASLLERWSISSLLAVPISRGEEIVGSLVVGYRRSTGPFSAKQRRLGLGIAHATALALENARLITDLQAANRVKTEFVSTMSHELRTPLNVMLGYAEMAQDVNLGERERLAYVHRIQGAGRDLLDLIESTLEVGRMEAGHDGVRLEPVPLAAFCNEVRRACASLPRRDGVRLEWPAAPDDVVILTDPRKLTLVLRNLVGNALKFTEQGWVCVEVRVDENGLLLRVSDSGIGIRPEDSETIFEMFHQADNSDRRRFGGSGLGLYIVRRCVEQLGGTIAVESAPGHGAAFTLRLPAPTMVSRPVALAESPAPELSL